MECRVTQKIETSSAVSDRITAADAGNRGEIVGSILALAAVTLLAIAILAGSRIPAERHEQLFEMRSNFVAP